MEDHERRDLAAMLQPFVRALIEAELPVLARHGITMWGYVVLNALRDAPQSTQAALAEKIGADKTRIIATLDDLQAAGLITREPDPADRRARLLSITPAGSRARRAVQEGIQRGEERVLAELPPAERRAFLRAAERLSALPAARILAGPLGCPGAAPGAGPGSARTRSDHTGQLTGKPEGGRGRCTVAAAPEARASTWSAHGGTRPASPGWRT
jgi:DNA-binding MarR family transcriptional regulator